MSALSTLSTTEPTARSGARVSTRPAAIDLPARMRVLHQDLAHEFEAVAPPGRVLALAVRSARALRRGGCSAELLPAATECLVRADLGLRGPAADVAGVLRTPA